VAKVQTIGANLAEAVDTIEGARQRITANDGWMPRSGYGPYCTIPISSGIDRALLRRYGVPSFVGARDEVKFVAEGYAARAVALATKAQEDRLYLAREIRGVDDERLIRPYRVRLSLRLDMPSGYLYLGWRGVVKQRGRWTRIRAGMWDCQADLSQLVANVHPAEELLIRRIEADAADIRRRWFALVRMIHYMNVAEEHRLADFESGRIQGGGVGGFKFSLMRRLQGAFGSRGLLS